MRILQLKKLWYEWVIIAHKNDAMYIVIHDLIHEEKKSHGMWTVAVLYWAYRFRV